MSITTGTCQTHAGDFVTLKAIGFSRKPLCSVVVAISSLPNLLKKILLGPSTIDLWNRCLCGDSQYAGVRTHSHGIRKSTTLACRALPETAGANIWGSQIFPSHNKAGVIS